MTDQKPYLLRAIYEWIVDNGETPQLMVVHPNKGWVAGVPDRIIQSDHLILNISPQATPDCMIKNDGVYFSARFGGQSCRVTVAIEAISAIFSKESQQGMALEVDQEFLASGPKPKPTKNVETENSEKKKARKNSRLKIIK